MVRAAPVRPKINTKTTQPARVRAARPAGGRGRAARPANALARVSGDARQSVRSSDRPVVQLGCGVVVYPSRGQGDVWRAVWVEDGRRRYREAVTEQGLAAKLEKVIERLSAGAAKMERPGAELIAFYLSPDRLPAGRQWSRKHAHTQRRLCERFAVPVIGDLACQDITTGHMQQIVNAAPTPGEGGRVAGMISALVGAGIAGGYLVNPRLKEVHWQAGDRPLPPPLVSVAGESLLFVDPAEIPASADVARLGQALAAGRRGDADLAGMCWRVRPSRAAC
jgi:hypothetical protein